MEALPEFDEKGRRISITVWYPVMPPSANKLYFKGTMLQTPAREYREQFKMHMAQHYLHQFGEMPQPNSTYVDKKGDTVDLETKEPNLVFGLHLAFYTNWLTSWGDERVYTSQRAKFRFKKVDLSNRIKFVEDCFKYALGIDDSLTFYSTQMKVQSPEKDGVMITYFVLDPEKFGIPRVPGGEM